MCNEYTNISKQLKLTDKCYLGVDQYGGDDRTCLGFAKFEEDKISLLDFKYIEKQEDIVKCINVNMKEIYGTFGLSLEELGGND